MIGNSARLGVGAWLLVLSLPLSAQDRPRIGLVLSGGGARGAAHVGVLEVLEELRVPIDAIAGTSMGAVVGGLYASGMTPEEIGRALNEADWAEAFRDAPLRKKSSFRRKQDDQGLLARPQVGLRDRRVRVPRGLIQGQNLEFLLRSLTLHASMVDDFDRLGIPFRAVAADLATGEAVVLGAGDLVTAMRASMAIPGAFAPVERDGRLLVDGGVAENLPVEIAREMGVDLVIAVDISAPLYALDKLDNPAVIADQMLTILMRRTTEQRLASLSLNDIGLVPKLDGFTSASFAKTSEMIALGRAAACEQRAQLARWALLPEEWTAHLAARTPFDRTRPRIDEIQVTTDGRLQKALTSRLSTRVGEELDLTRLHDDLERIHGLGLFEQVGFALRADGERTVLGIKARERAWGPNYLRFGLGLRDDFAGSTGWDFGLRYTATGFNTWGAEWRTDVRLGETQAVASEFYQPLLPLGSRGRSDRGFFIAPRFERRRLNFEVFEGGALATRYRLRGTLAALDLGYELDSRGEIRLGLERERIASELKLGPPTGLLRQVDETRAFVRLDLDQLDSVTFPSDGFAGSAAYFESFRALGARRERRRASFDVLSARPLGKFAVASGLSLGTTFADSADSADLEREAGVPPFVLGGLFRLSGLRGGEQRGEHVALARVIAYRRASLLGQKLYLGTSVEWGNTFATRNDFDLDALVWNGSLFAGADTILGPIYLGAGFAEDGRRNFYFVLGRAF